MSKQVHTKSAEGFTAETTIGDYSIPIDATGESAPDTLQALLGIYASCYVPAMRVAAEQRDVGDLGEIDIEATGELNDSDKLDAVAFDITTGSGLDADQANAVRERANELCKVHDAVKESLKADITIDGTSA